MPLSFSLSLSLINAFYTLISTSVAYFNVDILQQPISTLLGRAYHQSSLQYTVHDEQRIAEPAYRSSGRWMDVMGGGRW